MVRVQMCMHRSVGRNVDVHGCARGVRVCAQMCVQARPCVQACVHTGRHRCVRRSASRDACAYPRVSQMRAHTRGCTKPPVLPTLGPPRTPIAPHPAAGPGGGHSAVARSGGQRRAGCAFTAGTWRRSVCVGVRVRVCLCVLIRVCAPLPAPVCPCVCVSLCVPAPGPAPALPITRRPL